MAEKVADGLIAARPSPSSVLPMITPVITPHGVHARHHADQDDHPDVDDRQHDEEKRGLPHQVTE